MKDLRDLEDFDLIVLLPRAPGELRLLEDLDHLGEFIDYTTSMITD